MTAIASHRRLEVVLPKAAAEFHRLPTTVQDILRLCYGQRSIEVICACSPIAADQTAIVLRRLVALGMVAPHPPGGRPRRALTPRTLSWVSGELENEPIRESLRSVDAPPATPPTSDHPSVSAAVDFTDDEETFFSRSIEHLIEDL
jgi:hypothetical protein